MRRAAAVAIVAAAVVAACGQGALLSRTDALHRATNERGVADVTRKEAKLMTWPQFLEASQVEAPSELAPPGKQRVWIVAVAGDLQLGQGGTHQRWVIFIYNAVTGDRIGLIPGPSDEETGQAVGADWPPHWEQFPDSR